MKHLLIVIISCLALTACGRRGAPTPPGPAADITYPHPYPSQ
jgi:predicted small lipoprotein YifL